MVEGFDGIERQSDIHSEEAWPSVTTGLKADYQRVAEMQKTERIGAGKEAAGKEKRSALTFLTFSICKFYHTPSGIFRGEHLCQRG